MSGCYEVTNPFRKWRRAKCFTLGQCKCKYGDKVPPPAPWLQRQLLPGLCMVCASAGDQHSSKITQKLFPFPAQEPAGALSSPTALTVSPEHPQQLCSHQQHCFTQAGITSMETTPSPEKAPQGEGTQMGATRVPQHC